MLRGVGRYIRQHHPALIALFVALSGTAYATSKIGPNDIARNAVRSKHIKNGQVKLSDTSDKLRLKCPGGTRYHEGACIERDDRGSASQANALADCEDDGRRLPTPAELLSFRLEPGITLNATAEWTVELDEDTLRGVTVDEGGVIEPTMSGDSLTYRCVARPKR